MVNRRTRAAKKSNEKDSAITKDSDNDGGINESSDNIIQDTVSEDSRKKPNNSNKKKKTTETEKLEESEKVSKRTRRRGKDSEENNEESENLKDNNEDPVDTNDEKANSEENNEDTDKNSKDSEEKNKDIDENSKDPIESSKDPEENNDIDDSVQIIEEPNSILSIEDSENEEAEVNVQEPEETNGDPLNCSDPENDENSKPVNDFSDGDENSPLNIENYLQIESSLQNDEENSQNEENSNSNNIQNEKNGSENGENSRQDDNEEQKNDDLNEDTQKDEKPGIGLRLVPLNLLLRQDILKKQDDKKKDGSRSTRKSTGRNRKRTSYIEISSDEDEQISLSSESSESENSSDDESLSSLKRNTRRNNSTKSSKLSNGTKDKLFKEPMSPSKIMKNSKSVSINLEKMPDNVNKLMKCYRVNEDPIEMWSESDDFENMISTSKIDRAALDKEKQDQEVIETPKPAPRELKRSGKSKKTEEVEKEKPERSKKEKKPQKEKEVREPTRSRSTRNAAMNRRKIVDDDTESEESESEEESEEDVPLKTIAKSTTTNNKPTRNTRGRNSLATSESEIDKESTSKEQSKNNSENESDKASKSKEDKSKDKKSKDDHSKEKVPKRTQRQETSSDEEEKEKETQSRSTRSTRTNKEQQNAAKKSKTESKTTSEKRSSPRKDKTANLKITISLNQKKVINHSNENIDDSSKSDSDISSKSDSNDKEIKKKVKSKKISSDTSDSEDEPLTALKSKSLGKDEKKSSDKESENSDKEKKKSDGEETSPIVDQKLRNRNKFEANKEFNKLKELIERKKKNRKISDDEEETKDSVKKNDKGKENHDKNGEEESTTSEKSKRKRLLSSSEEEENDDNDSTSNKKKSSKNDLETPAKKRKINMDDDSDYNNSEREEDKNSDESQSSDDENIKRKAKRSSDDEDEDIDELEKGRLKAKRRKRIKKIASSDEDGDDKEKGGKASGRKTIRKIMKNDKLDISTKEAAKIERERKQRIEERQKAYNQFYDERPEEIKEITSLVLDFDEETKEPILEVDKKLVKKLKPHQANGIKFMWDACFESVERCRKESGSGCILAHCMGLGKTLQVVTLTHTLLNNSDDTDITRVLVVCPLNTVLNWVNEFHKWLKGVKGYNEIEIYEISKLKQNIDRANKLMEWHNEGGVMIMSYDMFRNLTNDQNNRLRKKLKESLQTSLIDPGPDLVVCDEGHLLKNEKTSISKCMMKLRTSRRIVLTGTPLQNNLKEYYCMVQFVKPNLLGKYQEYMNRFVNPITNGQYTDSTEYDIQVMRRRAHVLHKMLDGCVQRRDYGVLAPFLPPKHEYVLSIKLSPMQARLYKHYMENKARQGDDTARKGSILFQDFQNLQRIWSAPKALRYNSDRYEVEMQRKRDLESEEESEGSIKDFIDDSESAVSTSSSSDGGSDDDDGQSVDSDEGNKKKKKKKDKGLAAPRRTRAAAAAFPSEFAAEEEEIAASSKMENPTEWWTQICPEEELNNIEHSSKLMLLMSILEKCEAIGDKLLVFSQSLYSLDVIEHFLNYIDDQTQHNYENATFKASWTLGQDYFRLDGSTPVEQRNQACKHFNSPDNPRARLFLISTRAGGLGINLVAANRVVIFDVSWNPSHDIQSIFRVYRFGQTKPCYIYRFLALGTMEEKIYERQVTKQAISKRVIDEQQIDRHYNQNDLQELYKYELEPDDEVREIPILPKDRLFAEMLQKYEDIIWKYHEHDTLLENKEEETLDENERKQAWEEFEQEKTRPQLQQYYPQPQIRSTGPVTSNNIFGIRTDILLKLLSMKARLDNPTITETNIKHAIPLLMQELYRQMDRGELTLYQQLLALSSSLEVPQNYGGKFQVNEALMHQTYNSINSMPSTSSHATNLYRSQLLARQQNLSAQLQRQKQMRRMSDTVIEID